MRKQITTTDPSEKLSVEDEGTTDPTGAFFNTESASGFLLEIAANSHQDDPTETTEDTLATQNDKKLFTHTFRCAISLSSIS